MPRQFPQMHAIYPTIKNQLLPLPSPLEAAMLHPLALRHPRGPWPARPGRPGACLVGAKDAETAPPPRGLPLHVERPATCVILSRKGPAPCCALAAAGPWVPSQCTASHACLTTCHVRPLGARATEWSLIYFAAREGGLALPPPLLHNRPWEHRTPARQLAHPCATSSSSCAHALCGCGCTQPLLNPRRAALRLRGLESALCLSHHDCSRGLCYPCGKTPLLLDCWGWAD